MFEILIYLFETYVHSESSIVLDYNSLIIDLSDVGFHKQDIYNALCWLKNISGYKKKSISSVNFLTDRTSTRVYTKEEILKLNSDCRGFILFLEQLEILNLDTRELIIEKIMELDIQELKLEDLKWIALIVLFNIPGYEQVYRKLENLLFNFKEAVIH